MDNQNKEQNEVGSLDTAQDRIYGVAKAHLGMHITLNPTVPADVGCAEAVSFILKNAGITGFPVNGFASTADLNVYLVDSSSQFKRLIEPSDATPGCVWISPSGYSSTGAPHGHVGISGKYGILSNDSATGLFLELWTPESWQTYYEQKLGFPIFVYQAVN